MNAAIKRNAALRGKRSFLGGIKRPAGPLDQSYSVDQPASDATRKTLRERYRQDVRAERRHEWMLTLIGLVVGLLLAAYIWGIVSDGLLSG